MNLEERVNSILAEWNPIGVPEFIALDEYRDYIPMLIQHSNTLDSLEATLCHILEDYMEIKVPKTDRSFMDIKTVCEKLFDAISFYQGAQ